MMYIDAGARSSELRYSSRSGAEESSLISLISLMGLDLDQEPSDGTAESVEENRGAEPSVDIDLETRFGTLMPICWLGGGARTTGY
jgi:hypothetical protein